MAEEIETVVWCCKGQRIARVKGQLSPRRLGGTKILHVKVCLEKCPYKNSVDCLIGRELDEKCPISPSRLGFHNWLRFWDKEWNFQADFFFHLLNLGFKFKDDIIEEIKNE